MPSFSLFKSSPKTTDLTQRLLAETLRLLPRTPGLADLAEMYITEMSVPDLKAFSAADLAATIQNLWEAGASKPPLQSSIRAYMPATATNSWNHRHAVLDIVQKDMPFLIDSVTSALHERGLNVHLVVHPAPIVERDSKNNVKSLKANTGQGGSIESWAQFYFDACAPALLTDIAAEMARVMQDVDNAVTDWRTMRQKIEHAAEGLKFSQLSTEADRQESIDFLQWLGDNHFTFLGSRDYLIDANNTASPLSYMDGTGLGVLKGDISAIVAGLNAMLPELGRFTGNEQLLLVTKTDAKSTVHRAVPMDAVIVKLFNDKGDVIGERLFVGLLTSLAYSRNARDIPLLRKKAARVLALAKLDSATHNGKALIHILDTYPRDELFQINDDDLYDIAFGIMQLQERQRVALFVRHDYFDRFISCLIFIPRENFDSNVRQKIVHKLEEAYQGTLDQFTVRLDQDPLMRLHIIIRTPKVMTPDVETLEAEIASLTRSWQERLRDAIINAEGEAAGLAHYQQYANAFNAPYRDSISPEEALQDIAMIERVRQSGKLGVHMRLLESDGQPCCSLKLYHPERAVHLSTTLPMIENMGLKIATEVGPFDVTLPDGSIIWLHDYHAPLPEAGPDITSRTSLLEEAFLRVWQKEVENDVFNRLVLEAGLTWREASLMRALGKYLRQIRLPFTSDTMALTLSAHPVATKQLVQLFTSKFDPDLSERTQKTDELITSLTDYIRAIPNLDEDRILSAYLNILKAAVRTNYYQTESDSQTPKSYISIKFLSGQIDALPLPKPYAEIFVYSPRVEAIHLRGGLVARGGIRWSDRLEDFRTEVLGLMKAQMVKNAVIVPGGSKGGFVVKQTSADPQAEGIACYRLMMQGLLDITDNYGAQGIITPPRTVRHDGDDPYLVVAADKGTAKFSDIANDISVGYGFWLGDAFASGGSAGYDHKVMGITARGAWEAVKRHFRELGLNTQTQPFTTLGVGDMAGDVFGNGMLLSDKIELVAAFNYAHIFLDPTPNTETSFAERQRLFALGRGSWDQYDSSLISAGGGVYPRSLKSIPLSAEVKQRFGFTADAMSPNELIRALLKSQVDLIYFGGIGTYIKAEIESDLMVGDKANDDLRVNAEDISARVIGEGANLGITQRARIALASKGIKLNTDAIDNSAGVDTSDHEVNIKILLTEVIRQQKLKSDDRNALLKEMTDVIAQLVLRDNYLQTQALTLAESRSVDLMPSYRLLIQRLESNGLLNRAVEYLPDDAELARRETSKQGLMRPELAVLLAYSKIWLYDLLLQSPLLNEPALTADLLGYFPPLLIEKYDAVIPQHRLAKEITATVITNEIVNRLGLHAVSQLMKNTGCDAPTVVRSYLVARRAFNMPALWTHIEQLDNKVTAKSQSLMMLASMRSLEQAMTALLASPAALQDLTVESSRQENAWQELSAYLTTNNMAVNQDAALLATGETQVPEALGNMLKLLGWLPLLPRLAAVAQQTGKKLDAIIPVFMAVDERLQLHRLSRQLQQIASETPFQAEAITLLADDMLSVEQQLAVMLVKANTADLADWLQSRHHSLTRYDELVRLVRSQTVPDFALWSLISRELLTLADGD